MKKINSIAVKLPLIVNIVTIMICVFIIVSLINLASSEIDNYANQYMIPLSVFSGPKPAYADQGPRFI